MKKAINKKDLGILLIIIDIIISIFVFKYHSVPAPELTSNIHIFISTYFSESKLFFIGLLLILLDYIENKNVTK